MARFVETYPAVRLEDPPAPGRAEGEGPRGPDGLEEPTTGRDAVGPAGTRSSGAPPR
jgi:hypothetical protein